MRRSNYNVIKRTASIIMASVLVLTGLPTDVLKIDWNMTVYAAEYTVGNSTYEYTKSLLGNVTITGYTGTDTVLNIPAEIDGGKVLEIKYDAFYDCDGLTEINFPTTLTIIGQSAFAYCDGLTEVEIPDNVTRELYDWFYGCENLEKIKIGKGITKIDISSFKGLKNLKEVTFSEGLKEIEYDAFYDCDGLTEINFPTTLTTIGQSAFAYCDNLATIYFHGSVPEVGSSFIPNRNTLCAYYNVNGGDWTELINTYDQVIWIPFEGGTIDDIVLYADEPIRNMEPGDVRNVFVSLVENGEKKAEQGTFSFVIGDTNVVDISNICTYDSGTGFTITAKAEGNTLLTITNNETGEKAFSYIFVKDHIDNQVVVNVPEYEELGEKYNYYKSGMYVADCLLTQVDENNYNMSMNVWNTKNIHGALDVYNANGDLIQSVKIEKFEGQNITSFEDTVLSAYWLLQDVFAGQLCTFKAKNISEMTSVNVNIPKGGHVNLSNDASISNSCLIYNIVDISMFTVTKVMDATFADNSSEEEMRKALEKSITNSGAFEGIMEKARENLVEEVTISIMGQTIYNFSKTGCVVIEEIDFDLEDFLYSSVVGGITSVPEEAFYELAGPAGTALEGAFIAADFMNFYTQIIQLCGSADSGILRCDTKNLSGKLVDNGIKVDTADEEYVLRTFKVETGEAVDKAEAALEGENFELYDIYMMKNDKVTQPTGNVKVSIPIPEGYSTSGLKVYRIEENGARTDMSARVEGDYLVFETNHFSLYAVVEGDIIYGDANGDGKITVIDAILINRYIAGYENLNINLEASNVNGDTKVNVVDAIMIMRHLAGYDVVLGQ